MRSRNGRNSAATASVDTATANPDRRHGQSDQQHQREVGRAERQRQRAVDQRPPDHEVDVVEPVAEDRHAGRDGQRREREQAEHEGRVGHEAVRHRRDPEAEADEATPRR